MKLKLALIICGFSLLTSAARAEMDVTTLLNKYDSATSVIDKQIIAGIVDKTHYGISWANAFLEDARKEAPLYCQPKRLVLTTEQILDILRREVKEQPVLGEEPYGLAMIIALRKVFPCQPNSNSGTTAH
jgi:hypothetical protein